MLLTGTGTPRNDAGQRLDPGPDIPQNSPEIRPGGGEPSRTGQRRIRHTRSGAGRYRGAAFAGGIRHGITALIPLLLERIDEANDAAPVTRKITYISSVSECRSATRATTPGTGSFRRLFSLTFLD